MRKLVEWDHIEHIYDEIWDLLPMTVDNPEAYQCLKTLKVFFEDNIIQEDREHLNGLKREVYLKIINAESEEERQQWYKVYQNLKTAGNDR